MNINERIDKIAYGVWVQDEYREMIAQLVEDACKEQRELCAKQLFINGSDDIDRYAATNAKLVRSAPLAISPKTANNETK